ncbi:MAG: NAD-dependent epimerase/dehydratase family protein, partial [Agathobacter sp.]|nr:NAD-dependent epimerase/dehydratase family protein [Agathobacter sp.]
MKKIVMTGPTGAIGVALIEQCINENIEVYALCRKDSRRISNIPQSPLVHIIFCDLQEMSEFNDDQIKGADVFYHFGWAATIGAGRNDMPLQIQNIQYTIDAVHLAKRLGCSVFVGAGSQAEYGRVEGKLNAEVPTFPENGYGMAKLCAGQMSRVECEKLGLKHIWTRILSIYGPYDGDATMITSTIKKLLNGQIPELTKGEQMWDYMYSKDVAKAFVALGDRGVHGKIYCLGSGQVRPLKEYIEILRDKIDVRAKLGFGEIPYAP